MRAKEFLKELGINTGKPGDTLGQRYKGLLDPNHSMANVKSRLIGTTSKNETPPPEKQVGQEPSKNLPGFDYKSAAKMAGITPGSTTPPPSTPAQTPQDTKQPGTALAVPTTQPQTTTTQSTGTKKYDNSNATDIDFREVPKTTTSLPAPAAANSQDPTTTPVAQKAAAASAAATTAPTAPTLGSPSASSDSQQNLAKLSANAYPQQKVPGKSTGFLAGVSQGFKQGMGGREGETYAQLAARKAAGGLGLNATSQAIGSLPKAGTKIKDPQLGDIEVLPNDPAHNNMMAVKTQDGRKIFVDPKDL